MPNGKFKMEMTMLFGAMYGPFRLEIKMRFTIASVISFMIKHFEMIGFYFASAFFIHLRAWTETIH